MNSPCRARLTDLCADFITRRASLRLLAALLLGVGVDAADVKAAHPVRNVQHRAAKRRQRQHHRLKQHRVKQRRQNTAGPAEASEISNLVEWTVENRTADTQRVTFWWFDQYNYRTNPRPWSPLRDVDLPPGGKATQRQAINVFGVEFGFQKAFAEFIHHRNDGPRQPLDAWVHIDGKMDRIGYRFGTEVFKGKIAEGAPAVVTIRDRTLTLIHDPDLPNEARVRVVIT